MVVDINSPSRQYMKTMQEEAANIIVQQMAEVKANEVMMVVDDTEIWCSSVAHVLPRWLSNFALS